MARQVKPLTDAKVRNARPADRPLHLFDGGGLFLLVTAKGGKWWRFKYRFKGKQKTISFGVYPDVTLDEAREQRHQARKLLKSNIDPGAVRKAEKAGLSLTGNSFEAVAREWHEKFKHSWSDSHTDIVLRRLELNVFPWLGSSPISEISPPELLDVLRRVESRGAIETAHRIRMVCSQVFRYAVASGLAERDPTVDLRGALPPSKETHLAAITDPKRAAALLMSMDSYKGSVIVRCAMRFLALTFVRPGELRHAEWSEIDFDAALWEIPAGKMKVKEAHVVPLSSQAISVLNEVKALTGSMKYVFPSVRSVKRPMSENTVNAALRRMGYNKDEMTGHGFRAMARTILDEVLHIRPELIEQQLAHVVRDPLGRAYNRTKHLEERTKMMQQWADYLDDLVEGKVTNEKDCTS